MGCVDERVPGRPSARKGARLSPPPWEVTVISGPAGGMLSCRSTVIHLYVLGAEWTAISWTVHLCIWKGEQGRGQV